LDLPQDQNHSANFGADRNLINILLRLNLFSFDECEKFLDHHAQIYQVVSGENLHIPDLFRYETIISMRDGLINI
jgi:hypothetical protein